MKKRRLFDRVETLPWLCDLPKSRTILRIRNSGVTGQPENALNTRLVVEWLEAQGIETTRRSSGSAANADAYTLRASFLDGGLWGMTGNYWAAPRGVWIVGDEATKFVLSGLAPGET